MLTPEECAPHCRSDELEPHAPREGCLQGFDGKLDFVAESFNVLNHTNLVALNQVYGPENSPIPAFTKPNKASIPRQLQFSIDFEF